MIDLGDRLEDSTLNFMFHTVDVGGASITLVAASLDIYKDNSTTQITAATGITLTVDFDGVTGMHQVNIDTSAHADYVAGADYMVVISAGTVDSISVTGTVLATFSIENRSSSPANLLKYDLSTITGEATRSTLNSIRKLMNKIALSGSTLTVYKEDDATAAYTQTVGTSASQQSIISMDTN